MRGKLALAAFTVATLSLPTTSIAHPGGLDTDGCHHDRKSGGYHCHGGRSSAPTSNGAGNARPLALTASGGAFRNCSEARAAGAAPVYRSDPGYGPHLDRDGDGVGCEPYRGR